MTRAIGDVYLKHNEFNRDPLPNRFKQQQPIVRPIVKAEPTVQTYQLGPDDRFIIFASDGLWAEIDNEEAVTLVKYAPRSVSASPNAKVRIELPIIVCTVPKLSYYTGKF